MRVFYKAFSSVRKNMSKKILLSLVLVSLLAPVAFAQSQTAPTYLQNGLSDVEKILVNVTNWMDTIFLALAVIFFLVAAFKYLTSGGGEEVAKAHNMVIFAAVAIAVAMLAKGVEFVVKDLLQP